MRIRVLAVDDEKPGRERLRRALSRDPRIELAACCTGGLEAVAAVRAAVERNQPIQILFLDVQMPEMDGFAVVAALAAQLPTETLPLVVFVTAHDEYAVRAFETHAVDYLLKPFSDERFQAALDRTLKHIDAGLAQSLIMKLQTLSAGAPVAENSLTGLRPPPSTPIERLVVRGARSIRLLPVAQISWIEADGMYVQLHTRDGSVHFHRELLGDLESALDPKCFARIHRSSVVNVDAIGEFRHDAHGELIAVMRDATELRVGRRYRQRLESCIGHQL